MGVVSNIPMIFRSLQNRAGLILLLLLAGLACVSCQTADRVFKAKWTKLSPFIKDQTRVKWRKARGPFHATWTAARPEHLKLSNAKNEIFIAPVEIRHLREIRRSLAGWEQENNGTDRPVWKIATKLREEFNQAFRESPNPRFRPVPEPTPNSLTLRIALIELDPTSVKGNVVKSAGSTLISPFVTLAGRFTMGSIAIEGRLTDSKKGWTLFQFADREHDKLTYVSVRDFQSYGHAEAAIREWARQFEQLTRNSDWRKMPDSSFFTLNPF